MQRKNKIIAKLYPKYDFFVRKRPILELFAYFEQNRPIKPVSPSFVKNPP
jgi:hypothetical protein